MKDYYMESESFLHTPVLLNEVLKELLIKPDGIYVDATVGGAGHSLEISKRLSTGKIFAFDKDPDAVYFAKKRLKNKNVVVFNADFACMEDFLKNEIKNGVDGVLMDLGVSSFQLDNKKRGFSYRTTCDLDMRMSKTGKSAKDILNFESKENIVYILKNFGEEKFAKKIAEEVVAQREKKPFETTTDFTRIIDKVVPFKFKRKKNPFKKSFQALRIAVNNELFSLQEGLKVSFSFLKSKGRLLVISFHSLEDKIVKNFYKEKAKSCDCPDDFPICICKKIKKANIITKKPITPSQQEIKNNHRSRSAKLRILEKIWFKESLCFMPKTNLAYSLNLNVNRSRFCKIAHSRKNLILKELLFHAKN